ncbi:MAG: hypothetical protein NVSMB64_24870 [Candidatus Velthaea sp.]
MLHADASLIDVAFAVCTALDARGEKAVLTGGSAATFYTPEAYQSLDADFVLRFGVARRLVDEALSSIGYARTPQQMYAHRDVPFTVEFPPGPLAIGRDLVSAWSTHRRPDQVLHVLSPTDCVRDRFLHYYAWGDATALRAAVAVARDCAADFDAGTFRLWTQREHDENRAYDLQRVDVFFRRLAQSDRN